jgi:hypothetical protein
MKLSQWVPGFERGDQRLVGDIYATMPACEASAIPGVVRKYENPASSAALPGATTLQRHDIIHVLIGRGLLQQDEAFVIGFTMGAATDADISHVTRLACAAVSEYPKPFKIEANEVLSMYLGFYHTQRYKDIQRNLHNQPLEDLFDVSVSEARKRLGINCNHLTDTYKIERSLLPKSHVSLRLPMELGFSSSANVSSSAH